MFRKTDIPKPILIGFFCFFSGYSFSQPADMPVKELGAKDLPGEPSTYGKNLSGLKGKGKGIELKNGQKLTVLGEGKKPETRDEMLAELRKNVGCSGSNCDQPKVALTPRQIKLLLCPPGINCP